MKIDNNNNQLHNKLLKLSLTMINQYFLHARMLEDWGFNELGNKNYKFSIQAMKESDKIIKRILFLEGLPNLQALGKLNIGEDVAEILSSNLNMELEFHAMIQHVISEVELNQDYISRDLLNECLEDCEERIDYFETQIHISQKIGTKNYHQSII
ncbi:MAG: bacterioferritin [Marinicellaceae bacterium]